MTDGQNDCQPESNKAPLFQSGAIIKGGGAIKIILCKYSKLRPASNKVYKILYTILSISISIIPKISKMANHTLRKICFALSVLNIF